MCFHHAQAYLHNVNFIKIGNSKYNPIYLHQYELRLVASDNLNENYTTVVIHVNDVNDNPPVFDRPTYETQITEEDDRNLPKRVLKVSRMFQSFQLFYDGFFFSI